MTLLHSPVHTHGVAYSCFTHTQLYAHRRGYITINDTDTLLNREGQVNYEPNLDLDFLFV